MSQDVTSLGHQRASDFLRAETELLLSIDRTAWPISDYVLAQRNTGPYQLPEPISHPTWRPSILVVGLNPSFLEGEKGIPSESGTLETDVQTVIDFYGKRFEKSVSTKGNHLHSKLESLFVEAFKSNWGERGIEFPERALGVSGGAVLCDAIPWKWTGGEKIAEDKGLGRKLTDAEWEPARERVQRIAGAIRPSVVISLGDVVGQQIFGRLPDSSPQGLRPSLLWPRSAWPILHIAAYHPTGSFGQFSRNRANLLAAIVEALPKDPVLPE
ncbi:hypothetical protein BH09CHL1_BH09CHL1_25990 [soil metagenome]